MAVISDNDITSIIADVEREVLGLAQETLAKGEGSKSASASASDGGSAFGGSDGGSASAPAPGDASSPAAPPIEAAAASPDPASAAPASATPGAPPAGDPAAAAASATPGAPGDPAAAAAGQPGADQGMGDHEALVSEFAKMPPEHVAMILEAAKQVLLSSQPPGGAPAPSPMEPSAAPQGLAQSEVGDGGLDAGVPTGAKHNGPTNPTTTHLDEVASNGGKPLASGHATASEGGKVLSPPKESGGNGTASTLRTTSQTPEGTLKSEVEGELQTLRKANQELLEKFERLTGVVTELVEKPIRKAITGMDYVNIRGAAQPAAKTPSENLDRTEITRRLNEKVRDPSLTKHDRELINEFYERKITVSKIEHLLK